MESLYSEEHSPEQSSFSNVQTSDKVQAPTIEIFSTYSSHPQKTINTKIITYFFIINSLPTSKHHPTNKKPFECGDNSTMNISHL